VAGGGADGYRRGDMPRDESETGPEGGRRTDASPPRLSVVMPVRDLADFADAAIASILGQTHGDFEFLIRDDGSVDGTREILRQWAARDPRIRLFESDESLGPAESSNFVVRHATGELIARMDADDVAHPDRLRRQVDALDAHPEACLVGSLFEGIDEQGRRVRPRDRSRLAAPTAFAPFPHGSIMFRRAAFDAAGGYRADADFWEDLDLYRRMAAAGDLLVIPAALYRHRSSPHSTRLTSSRGSVETSIDRMYRRVAGEAGRKSRRLKPDVWLSLGSTLLWAGRRPGVLLPLLRRGAIGMDRRSLAIVAWALWAEISPKTLRYCLRLATERRDRRIGARFHDQEVYRWDPV
jgi:glycosyltransferase involved in cell wall biosynthesis